MSNTHQLKFGLSTGSDADGLYALLARCFVIEAEECLVRLHSILSIRHLERELQDIRAAKRNGLCFPGLESVRVLDRRHLEVHVEM